MRLAEHSVRVFEHSGGASTAGRWCMASSSLDACIYDDRSAQSSRGFEEVRRRRTSNCRDTADVQAQKEVDITLIHICLHDSSQWIKHHRGTRLHLEIRLRRQVGVGGVGARLR